VSPGWIRTRETVSGAKRYQVLYRQGGRAWPVEAGGTFRTLKEARIRRDYVGGEIAGGRNPRDSLRRIEPPRRSLDDWFKLWLKTRIDVDERTRENYRVHWKRISPRFGRRRPDEIGHGEIQEWINDQTVELTPAVVRDYLGTFRQIIDQTGVEPNPARHRALRLPTAERPVHSPPSDEHVLAFLDRVRHEHRLLFIVLEQTGARLGESIGWTWADVDVANSRILSRPENVKGRRGRRRARWVQIPAWLFELLLESCPPDDRDGERPLFVWPRDVGHPRQKVEKVMAKACKAAGIPHYHPHDLRHRRITLWHGQGIPAREIGDRVGQRQISTTLDTYTHVMPLDEVPPRAYRRLLVMTR
jgi:integrase